MLVNCVFQPFSPRRWVSNMEGDQCFQPSGLFAGYWREALDPSHDGCLATIRTAGEITLGPAKDGQADQQPVAGHGSRRRGRFRLRSGVFGLPSCCVFKMNTSTNWAHGL